MPTPLVYRAPFAWNDFYHLLFRSNDGSLLFRNDRNRLFFMERFSLYLLPFFDCWAWNLIDNHAHFIVRTKADEAVRRSVLTYPVNMQSAIMNEYLEADPSLPILNKLLLRQINSFEGSYCQAYNKVTRRRGSLFQKPFRRSFIRSDNHLQQAIIYVHVNAQKHRLCRDFRDYPYSSYQPILNEYFSWVNPSEVLDFFGGKWNFEKSHAGQAGLYYSFEFENESSHEGILR